MNEVGFDQLETCRLIIRRFQETDLAAFLAYRNDPEIARYQSWDSYSQEQAIALIEELKVIPCGAPGLGFQFALELKATGALIGDCYLKVDRDEPRQAEIGFTLARAYQRQGFASEAVIELLDYAFRTLELHRIIAITDSRNDASVALLSRLGMRREGHFLQNVWFKGEWGDEYLYAVLRDEWMQRRGFSFQRGSKP
jgi:RimJ/RimL family protein N-acetyltransferase